MTHRDFSQDTIKFLDEESKNDPYFDKQFDHTKYIGIGEYNLQLKHKVANALYDFWKNEIKKTNGRVCECRGVQNCTDLSCAVVRQKIGEIACLISEAKEKEAGVKAI